MSKKKGDLFLNLIRVLRSRKYPIKYDEYGRSARQRAFELFTEGYRPSQIFKEKLIPVRINTLFRYFEDWKKQGKKIPYATYRKFFRENPEFSEQYITTLAEYFEVPKEIIILRSQQPWGLMDLSKGELPDIKLERKQSEKEVRLEAALRLIYLGEQFYKNSPNQVKRLILDIVTLTDNTRLVIQKTKGQVSIRKEKYRY